MWRQVCQEAYEMMGVVCCEDVSDCRGREAVAACPSRPCARVAMRMVEEAAVRERLDSRASVHEAFNSIRNVKANQQSHFFLTEKGCNPTASRTSAAAAGQPSPAAR